MSEKDCPVPEPFSGAIRSIFFLTLLFFLTFIARWIFAPLMPANSSQLGLSHSQAGSIFLSGSVGVFIGSLSAGFVSSRIQHKETIALSLMGTAFALLLTKIWGSSLRLTFKNVIFNPFKAVFKFSIILQLYFYAHNRTADRTVSVQPKTGTNSHQGF